MVQNILVIQLARYGDLMMTAPCIAALKRKFSDAKITLLCRSSFKEAAELIRDCESVKAFDEISLIEPLINDFSPQAISRLYQFLDDSDLSINSYDLVFNLSFSPISSFITKWCSDRGAEIKGYSRHEDGTFNPLCDVSAYFYAQVGIGRASRAHLSSVFAALCDVELCENDWRLCLKSTLFRAFENMREGLSNKILIHPFASEPEKIAPPKFWIELLSSPRLRNYEWFITGSIAEQKIATDITEEITNRGVRVKNLTGSTRLSDLVEIASTVDRIVGGDSLVSHISSITNTPMLQISCASVNLWETGPLSDKSIIYFSDNIQNPDVSAIEELAWCWLNNRETEQPIFQKTTAWPVAYEANHDPKSCFEWELIQSIYMGSTFPICEDRSTQLAFQDLFQISSLAIDHLNSWYRLSNQENSQNLQLIDGLLTCVERQSTSINPLIRWFQCERIRLKPASLDENLRKTTKLFETLQSICILYLEDGTREARVEFSSDSDFL